MKKLIITVLSILTLTTFGQTNRFNVGLEGGLSLASLRGNDFTEKYYKVRIGFLGGVSIQYNLSKLLSLRTEVCYERKGASLDAVITNENGEAIGTLEGKENLDYLTFPLLLRFSFGDKFKFFFNGGPYYSILLDATETFKDNPIFNSDHTSYFNNNEFGVTGGSGIEYNLKKFVFSLEVRDNLGLTNISALPVPNGGSIKTNALYVLYGVAYKLGEEK